MTSVTPVPTAGSTVTTSVMTATANEKSNSTGPTDFQGHDEKYWRATFDAARLAGKRAENNLKLADLRFNQSLVIIATMLVSTNFSDCADAYNDPPRIKGDPVHRRIIIRLWCLNALCSAGIGRKS